MMDKHLFYVKLYLNKYDFKNCFKKFYKGVIFDDSKARG